MSSVASPRRRNQSQPGSPQVAYLDRIWKSRFFWGQLARSDIRARYRRSTLGLIWAILVPAIMTALITLVIGNVFKVPLGNFAPFVFAGLVGWEFLVSAAVMGCNSLINAAPYIKQTRHPLAIYSLRCTVVAMVNFLLGMVGLAVYLAATKPTHLPVFLLGVVIAAPFFGLVAWPFSLITGFLNTRFRDTGQMIGIVMQMLWFASPVFIEPKTFRASGLSWLVDNNPIYHLLNLVRSPALSGTLAPLESFAYSVGLAVLLSAIAIRMIVKQESRMIFYL